jgi:hypothetical protein
VNWIYLAQDRDKWRSLINAEITPGIVVEHIVEFMRLQVRFLSSSLKLDKQ